MGNVLGSRSELTKELFRVSNAVPGSPSRFLKMRQDRKERIHRTPRPVGWGEVFVGPRGTELTWRVEWLMCFVRPLGPFGS